MLSLTPRNSVLLCVAGLFVCMVSHSQASEKLAEALMPVIESHEGDVAVCVRSLETGEEFLWRADEPQPTASLIKLAVMVTAYRMADAGELDLQRMVTLTEADKVPGSGILTNQMSAGLQLSVRDAVRLMIRYSDNTATNLVVDQIGLPATAGMMESLGFPNTKLHAKVYRGSTSIFPDRSQKYGLGSTTARETVALLEQIHNGSAASETSCRAMIDHLLSCDDNSKLGLNLPGGIKLAHKTGAVNSSRTDAGIIYGPSGPIAVCVLTMNNTDKSWKDGNAAHRLCGRIGRIVFDHFNPAGQRGAMDADAPLQSGSFGELVEMLQRTLNARMDPAPGLSVDGDFGPGTEAVVKQFQAAHSLPVTGIVDASFWKALGPIIPAEVVPDPETVNSEALPVEGPEPISGAPVVTCKAWTIVDLDSGDSLWSENSSTPLDIASTTKIMTAWLVLKLAQKDESILDEVLTFSDRADQTIGSTSALRAGERVSIREALYGLMLPSGNDMSVALAEHFGTRLHPQSERDAGESDAADPLVLFVEAMNAEAARLGMSDTNFRNPHGLTARDHVSTASDLAILARTALSDERFQSYVSTRRRGVTVEGPSGYRRNVLWQNTNQLLGIEGYGGVKTGTTDRAGACLVSTATRGQRRLLMVVLGSAASASRYADSPNLYRWAWAELQKQQLKPDECIR